LFEKLLITRLSITWDQTGITVRLIIYKQVTHAHQKGKENQKSYDHAKQIEGIDNSQTSNPSEIVWKVTYHASINDMKPDG